MFFLVSLPEEDDSIDEYDNIEGAPHCDTRSITDKITHVTSKIFRCRIRTLIVAEFDDEYESPRGRVETSRCCLIFETLLRIVTCLLQYTMLFYSVSSDLEYSTYYIYYGTVIIVEVANLL